MNRVPRKWTVEEYLAYEEETQIRHEFIDGEIYAMAGGSIRHGDIIMNLSLALGQRLRGSRCRPLPSDIRMKISETKYVYPDLSFICQPRSVSDSKEIMVTSPIMVIEVTSPSSKNYDLGLKAEFYQSLPSLQAYLVVDQDRRYATLRLRREHFWATYKFEEPDAVIPLDVLDCELPLSEVYEGIEFDG